jgi:putative DNA primase/helicase
VGSPKTVGSAKLRPINGGKSPQRPADTPEVDRLLRQWECTDTGNVERLIFKFGASIRYVPAWGEFIVFDETRWRRDIGSILTSHLCGAVIKMIKEEGISDEMSKAKYTTWQKKSGSCSARQAMLTLAKQNPQLMITPEELDADPYALNVKNGTLDLKTGELRPHRAEDFITKILPINYDPKAKAPRWTKFLTEILPDKAVRDFVLRWFGYCLTGDVSERMFVVFLGGGSNGKSVLINVIESVMGPYTTVAASTLLTSRDKDNHPTELADLFGVRLATTSEVKKGSVFDEEKLKRLTGGDIIKARRMHEDYWQFAPTFKLAILANHKPRVKDATSSFWDRVAIVPFEVRFTGKKINRKLTAQLKEEREGILAQLVAACTQWRSVGLSPPPAVTAATAEYKDEEDIAGRFLNECFVADKSATTPATIIIEKNKAWATAQNLFPVSSKDLAEKLRADPYCCVAAKSGSVRSWKGIRPRMKKDK